MDAGGRGTSRDAPQFLENLHIGFRSGQHLVRFHDDLGSRGRSRPERVHEATGELGAAMWRRWFIISLTSHGTGVASSGGVQCTVDKRLFRHSAS